MPNAQLKWIEKCGHVPHLEQPEETADAIFSFLTSEVEAGGESGEDGPPYALGAGFIGALALSQLAGAILQ